jgi:hypothetical protein
MKNKPNGNALPLFFTAILISSSFILSGFKKENNKDNTPTYYFKANIGGTSYSQTVTETNGYEAGSVLGGVDDVTVSSALYAGWRS